MSDVKDPAIKLFGKTIQLPSASDAVFINEHPPPPPHESDVELSPPPRSSPFPEQLSECIGEEEEEQQQESDKVRLNTSFVIIKTTPFFLENKIV